MIPVMFHLTRGRDSRVDFAEINNDDATEYSKEIQEAIEEFRRQGWETREVFIPKKVG
jgi:predicted deacetylase